VVIEDLLSTGKSSLAVVNVLREAGCVVIGLVALFEYGFESSKKALTDAKVPYETVTDFETLCHVAVDDGWMTHEQRVEILKFASSPMTWRNNAQLLAAKNQPAQMNSEEASALGHS
jgi:orotate phosphoribosyltransferase